MQDRKLESVLTILVSVIVAAAIALAGSRGSATVWGLPLFALCGILAFAINWVAFVPAYARRTEHFFDLVGGLSYLLVVAAALALRGGGDARALLLAGLVSVWAARLGTFLFLRIRRAGKDARFDTLKADFLRFLMTWTLQGLWVYVTLACALAAITTVDRVPLGWPAWVGVAVWILGFTIEAVADRQKRLFRADESNRGRFIHSGLWAWSRHPNYFGEITLWVGIAILAFPALRGWQLVTLISPLFVAVLLTRVSGIPLLDQRALQKWGDDPDYLSYRARTPALILRRPRGE